MGVTAALMAGSAAISSIGSITQGFAENKQAKINSQIYEAQARNIAEAQKITAGQYRTKENVLRGQAIATAARNGVKITGSTANSISQSIMQLQMENSYEQYNLEVKKQEAFNNAELQRYKGRQALMSGFIKAGTTALDAGTDYYNKYWKGTNTVKSGTKISGGFSPITNQQIINGNQPIV